MSQSHPAPETGKPLSFSAISAQLGFLKGEVLTIADATFSDKEQRKAFKDLIRGRFTYRLQHLAVLCEDGSVPCSSGSIQGRTVDQIQGLLAVATPAELVELRAILRPLLDSASTSTASEG